MAKATKAARAMATREIVLGKGAKLRKAADAAYPPGVIDRISGAFPGWKGRRDSARMGATIMAGGYDVTQPRRTQRGRRRGGEGEGDRAQPDQTLWELRETVRGHDRNTPLLHGMIERAADNVAGPEYGFVPWSGDKKFDADAADLLNEASAAAEFRGLFNLADLIYTGFRSLHTDGDFFLHHLADGTIQAIEAHELVTPIDGKGQDGRRVVGGVELDDAGRHVGYYVRNPQKTKHIGRSGYLLQDVKNAQRLEAADVQHVATRFRFSQTRAVPTLAPALGLYGRLDGFINSETMAAEMAAMSVMGIKRAPGMGSLPGVDSQTDPGRSSESLSTFDKILRMESGSVFEYLNDEEVKIIESDRPMPQFEPYVIIMMRMVGATIGQPLELVLLDFSKTNYSSARAALLQAYRTFTRWQIFVRDRIIQPIHCRWMSRWIASGELRTPTRELQRTAARLRYFPPRWAWIDPLKSVVAMQRQIAAGAGTIEEWIRERGRLPDEVFETRQAELQLLRSYRVPTSTAPDNLKPGEVAGEADDGS